jgi:hypothetical protein
LSFQFRKDRREVDSQKIIRHATNRLLKTFNQITAATQQGFVIASNQAIGAAICCQNGIRLEVGFKKLARTIAIIGFGQITNTFPERPMRLACHTSAGLQKTWQAAATSSSAHPGNHSRWRLAGFEKKLPMALLLEQVLEAGTRQSLRACPERIFSTGT